MEIIHLTIAVRCADNTYHARAIKSINASNAGLAGRKATCTAGEEAAVLALLRHATPVLELVEVHSVERGENSWGTHIFHITAKAAQP